MSLLADVAVRAGVPVEGVVRVVTRQPVSRRIEQRVAAVLNALDPEQLGALERLAVMGTPEVVTDGHRFDAAAERLPTPTSESVDELTLRLGELLEEVARCLNELRRDQLADRQDRVDDLAVLVDLMTTGWRGVDRRLARVERSLARLEPPREAPLRFVAPSAEQQEQAAAVAPQEAQPVGPAAQEPAPRPPARSRRRRWLAPATPILVVVGFVLTFLALELLASDAPRLGPVTETGRRAASPTSLSSTTGGPTKATTPTTTGRTTTAPATLDDTRAFAWPAQAGARYYVVRIVRGGRLVYTARPTATRLVLPETVTLTPGRYRWTVRVGLGAPAEKRLGATIVDSAFVVGG